MGGKPRSHKISYMGKMKGEKRNVPREGRNVAKKNENSKKILGLKNTG